MNPSKDSALSTEEFFKLKRVLAEANERFKSTAARINTLRRNRKARRRAQKLRLCTDITKAKACPHHAVSVIPLPVLATPTSQELQAPSASSSRRPIRCKRQWTSPPSCQVSDTLLCQRAQQTVPPSRMIIAPGEASTSFSRINASSLASVQYSKPSNLRGLPITQKYSTASHLAGWDEWNEIEVSSPSSSRE